MNFLAHILLSGSDPSIRFGNFIGDEIKGAQFKRFPEAIQKGIKLHRRIDGFTDSNTKTREILKLLYPKLGKVAGIALDIYNDHFLAEYWQDYSSEELEAFTLHFYEELDQFEEHVPEKMERLIYFMKKDNWLLHYRDKSRLSVTFENMVRKYPFAKQLEFASDCLDDNYSEINRYFKSFFPDLQEDAKSFLLSH
ncbi:MAG: ACP phosphodiesterase [Bacteroidota bacterium]